MADTKITQMPPASAPLTGQEVLPIVQGGANVQANIFEVTAATYGEIYVAGGVTAQNLASANTYYKVTGFTTDGLSNNATPDAATDSIQIDVAGDYLIQFFITFSDANNKTFAFRCYNETTASAYVNTVVKSHSNSTNPMFVAVSSFVSAAKDDVLSIQVACQTSSTSVTLSDANFAVLLLKAA